MFSYHFFSDWITGSPFKTVGKGSFRPKLRNKRRTSAEAPRKSPKLSPDVLPKFRKKTATGAGRLPEVRKVWKPSPVRQLQEGKVLRSEVPEGRLESPQEELQQVDRKEENSDDS